jgi:hypothetical protein
MPLQMQAVAQGALKPAGVNELVYGACLQRTNMTAVDKSLTCTLPPDLGAEPVCSADECPSRGAASTVESGGVPFYYEARLAFTSV